MSYGNRESFGGRDRGRSSDRGSRGRRDSFGSDSGFGERKRLEMHDAVCDKCGNACQLPFRPTQGKPVYCSDCFRKSDSRDAPRSNNSSAQLDEINRKLDKIMKSLDLE